jgi:N-acyl-D-aspartate/D-glutamate deacylase
MLTRREFLKDTAILAAAGLAAPLLSCSSSGSTYDTVIRNGTIYDGTTAAPFQADVGIAGNRIVAVGYLDGPAGKIIDARHCVVAPGFIDVHDHTDYIFKAHGSDREQARGNLVWMSNMAGLRQGVTTLVSGNCGYGYTDMNDYFAFLDSLPFAPNTYYLTPHGHLRQELFGDDQPHELTSSQLERLKGAVAREMEKGAIGMSSGLGYVPGIHCTKQELIELGKVLKRYNGIYASHIRNEPPPDYTNPCAWILEGILEAIDIGRQAGIPVEISHIKGYFGGTEGDYENICRVIENARAEGIDVTADQYPFTASSTSLSVLAPAEYRTDTGIKPEYWNDPQKRAEIKAAINETFKSLTPHKIRVTDWKTYQYERLDEIALQENKEVADLYVEMVCSEDCPSGIYEVIDEGAMEKLMAKEYVFTGSDGCAVPELAMYSHPRSTATFAKKLKHFALEKGVLTLQNAILSMTSRPAEKFGIRERGKIIPGYYADLCVIDPATLAAPATYEKPDVYSEGVRDVLVNGVLELADGSVTGLRGGRALRRS